MPDENPLEVAVAMFELLLVVIEVKEDTTVIEGAVGSKGLVLLVPLPYGPPLVMALEEKPLDAAVVVELSVLVPTMVVLLTGVAVEIPVGATPVGPTGRVVVVPLP